MLGGSWALVIRVLNRVTIVIFSYSPLKILKTLLTKSPDPYGPLSKTCFWVASETPYPKAPYVAVVPQSIAPNNKGSLSLEAQSKRTEDEARTQNSICTDAPASDRLANGILGHYSYPFNGALNRLRPVGRRLECLVEPVALLAKAAAPSATTGLELGLQRFRV